MPQLATSNIPAGLVPEARVDRALELSTAFSLPFQFGALEVPPLAIGTAALLEVGFVEVFKTQDITDSWSVAKLLFIMTKRKDIAPLIFAWRKWYESDDGIVFDVDDKKTYHKLDHEVAKFAKEYKIFSKENYIALNILELFEFVFVSFNGFLMIPENQHKTPKWIFDLPSVASHIHSISKTVNLTYDEVLWNFPVSMASHLIAVNFASQGEKNIERPYCTEFIDEYRQIIMERETKGKLHPWQYMDPDAWDISPMQADLYPNLVLEFAELRQLFRDMTKKAREKHTAKYAKILDKEITKLKKKIGLI